MAVKQGWSGRYYEDFEVGDIYPHPVGRTVTQTDNIWFTLLTVNPNPIHFDAVYAAKTEFGRPLVDSTFTLALVTGLSVGDLSQNAINLGWEEVRLPHPVFDGDTLYAAQRGAEQARIEVAAGSAASSRSRRRASTRMASSSSSSGARSWSTSAATPRNSTRCRLS